MISGLIFVFIKLFQMDLDYSVIFEGNNLILLGVIVLIYGINVLLQCVPWKVYLQIIFEKHFDFTEVAYVYTKSNIMKYIPGNVFQYVGRNEMAVRHNISHKEVILSTVFEILNISLSALLCVLILNAKGFVVWFDNYGMEYIKIIVIAVLVIVVLIILGFLFLKEKIMSAFEKIKYLITKKNIAKAFTTLIFSMFQHIIFATLFLCTLVFIVNTNIEVVEIPVILGAYILSWLVGYLTIGSPGGIGVRELVICLLLKGIISEDKILLAIVIFRVVSIFGDVVALIYAKVLEKINK